MKSSRKCKVLFFGESATLAHVSRPYELAASLNQDEYEIHFATSKTYLNLFQDNNFTFHLIECIPTELFNKRLAQGSPLYDFDMLDRYVQADIQLIQSIRPDIIVGDFRLSLSVSARLTCVPYVSISNAHWSPYAQRKDYPTPEHPAMRLLGVTAMEKLFPIIAHFAFKLHKRPHNKLRRKYYIEEADTLREIYSDADFVLYPELECLSQTKNLPYNHSYIPPVHWAPNIPLPKWCSSQTGKKAFVSLGTSGDVTTLKASIRTLQKLGFSILVATANRTHVGKLGNNVHVEKFVNGTAASKWADLVICNGGSGSVYQAIAGSTPVIGICSNMDQFFNMENAMAQGIGVCLRAGQVTEQRLSAAIEYVESLEIKTNVCKLSDILRNKSNSSFSTFINTLREDLFPREQNHEEALSIKQDEFESVHFA